MGVPSLTVCGVVWHAAQRLLTVWCAGTLGACPQVELYGRCDLWWPTKPLPSAAYVPAYGADASSHCITMRRSRSETFTP